MEIGRRERWYQEEDQEEPHTAITTFRERNYKFVWLISEIIPKKPSDCEDRLIDGIASWIGGLGE